MGLYPKVVRGAKNTTRVPKQRNWYLARVSVVTLALGGRGGGGGGVDGIDAHIEREHRLPEVGVGVRVPAE